MQQIKARICLWKCELKLIRKCKRNLKLKGRITLVLRKKQPIGIVNYKFLKMQYLVAKWNSN